MADLKFTSLSNALAALATEKTDKTTDLWDVGTTIHRTKSVPLDLSTIVFAAEDETFEDAAKRAASEPTAFPGQIITVLKNKSKTNEDGTTNELGEARNFIVAPEGYNYEKVTAVAISLDYPDLEEVSTTLVENQTIDSLVYKSQLDYLIQSEQLWRKKRDKDLQTNINNLSLENVVSLDGEKLVILNTNKLNGTK